jgi:hypothetical protein
MARSIGVLPWRNSHPGFLSQRTLYRTGRLRREHPWIFGVTGGNLILSQIPSNLHSSRIVVAIYRSFMNGIGCCACKVSSRCCRNFQTDLDPSRPGWELRRYPAFTGGHPTSLWGHCMCICPFSEGYMSHGMSDRPVSPTMEGKTAWKYSLGAYPAFGRTHAPSAKSIRLYAKTPHTPVYW